MEKTSSRLALTEHLENLFRKTPNEDIDKVIYLLQGKIGSNMDLPEIGLAEKLVIKSLSFSSGFSAADIEKIYIKTGDLGQAAQQIFHNKKQITLFTEKITVDTVFSIFIKIAKLSGKGSQELKLKYMSNLLNNASPIGAKYIIKMIMGTLRLGIADFTVLDALALAYTNSKSNRKLLEKAYNITNDIGKIAKTLLIEGLDGIRKIKIEIFQPIRPMLAERLPSSEEIIKKFENGASAEYKLDGERIQIHFSFNNHSQEKKVEFFSRKLEKITSFYPDLIECIFNSKFKNGIIEGEVVAINNQTGEFLPFQELMHRRRKYNIEKAVESYPVVINLFDILYLDDVDITGEPYSKRRKLLEDFAESLDNETIKTIPQRIVESVEDIEKFHSNAIEDGCEGLIIKGLSSYYRAGAREFAWIKLKREYHTSFSDSVDLVIVGAVYGRGRRVGKYGTLLLSIYDPENDLYPSICKVGTGFSDAILEELFNQLESHKLLIKHKKVITKLKMDVWFDPFIVIDVIGSEITLSPIHSAAFNIIKKDYGLALRFPKFTGKIRYDKGPHECTTTTEIIQMYKTQLRTSNRK